jgi:hypothetical protein
VPVQSDLHGRYMKALDAQETQIADLMEELDAARTASQAAKEAVATAIAAP